MSGIRRLVDVIHELLDIPLEEAEKLVYQGGAPTLVLELAPLQRLELCAMLGAPLYGRSHSQPAAGAGNNNMSTLNMAAGKAVCAIVLDAIFSSDAGATLLGAVVDGGIPSTIVSSANGAALDRRPGAGVFAADGAAIVQTGHRVGAPGGSPIWNQNLPATSLTRVATGEGVVVAPGRTFSMFQGTANSGGYFSWRWYEVSVGSND